MLKEIILSVFNRKYLLYHVQIRVSSEISNAPIILNLDCDMYSNNADTVREILCFFMDEKKGGEFAFVQFPQNYTNITKNDHYANGCFAVNEVSSQTSWLELSASAF